MSSSLIAGNKKGSTPRVEPFFKIGSFGGIADRARLYAQGGEAEILARSARARLQRNTRRRTAKPEADAPYFFFVA